MLLRNALVLSGAGQWAPHRADVLLEADRIAAVGRVDPGHPAAAEVIDCSRFLVIPGLVNAHYHSPLALLRGTADGLSHPAFMWQNQADTARRTPQESYVSALLGGLELLRTGTTAVIDHFPEQGLDPAHIEAVLRAYRELGLRAVVALRVFDGTYDDILPPGGLPPELERDNPLAVPPLDETMAIVEAFVARHRDPMLQVFPAPSNPGRCSDELLVRCNALGVGVHTHLLETKIQIDIARQRTGTTMVRHLDHLGVLTSRLSCAHTVWIDEHDIDLMAERGAVVVHNPESNLKVGAGVMPLPAMHRAGLRVALGTDGASTNDNLVLHEAMRLALILHRPSEPDRRRWLRAEDALDMATSNGAAALQLEGQVGRIQPGAMADLVLYDLEHPRWTPCNDPAQQLVFCETGDAVHTVIVNGRVRVREGRVLGVDAKAVVREAAGMLEAIRGRNAGLREAVARMLEKT